jgi:glycosyltransferase involved in cell wall biosynthesis
MLGESNTSRDELLSVVIPAYNEEEVIEAIHRRLSGVLASLPMRAEILYVNDGSTVSTLGVLQALRERDPRVGILDLSRNFGKEIALTAGIDRANGDAVVVIDADLLPCHQLSKPFPGCVAECLSLLRRVDPRDTDPLLHLVGLENYDRVAIGNMNDGAFENVVGRVRRCN